ncbi:agmatine deiminase [Chthonobacter albigriseus]|uniref:agmatine deiminase n=1 Tax=Chthonobacter albigriseus TaxID=1683161 RepID=UPI0015EEED2D|nr:agmatine deiminase [Chthonobacter albigriseus]
MADHLTSTPAADGFAMPAEWAPHAGCWMIWPERPDNWRLGAKPAQAAFTAVAEAIADFEPVTMIVSGRQFENARARLTPRIRVVEASTNDAWCRDTGPTFVQDERGRVRAVDWTFNAWGGLEGGLYFPWDEDDRLAMKIAEIERVDRYRAPFVLEGGSIHVDGEGTVLTTEECLLNPNRNPGLTRIEIEEHLKAYLGVSAVIWLGRGIHNDETNGHVDNIACFARPGVVLLSWCDDPADPQHAISIEAFERLSAARDAKGRALEIVKLPTPGPLTVSAEEADGVDAVLAHGSAIDAGMERRAGHRMAGSYVNFYIANGGIVAPRLDPRTDEDALTILRRVFPDRKVVGVATREILLGGGNIHCITQQQPL